MEKIEQKKKLPEIQRKLVLKFPKRLIDQPVIYRLTKDFDLMFNILKADISPDEEGLLVIELSGTEENFCRGVEFLKRLGIGIQPLSKDLHFDEQRCTHCGVCVPICPVEALVMDKETYKLKFLKDKCIACEICIKICPPRAIQLEF